MHLPLILLKVGERERTKKNWEENPLFIDFFSDKGVHVIQDVDKIFDRVGICVTRETREIIRIDFLTDTRFTYIGSCLGVGRGGLEEFFVKKEGKR